ncbi:carbohydrate binding domain-containing protein [Microlunatus sp. GCM10028923]|uniref:carbohydrate binding domain-containing protein n=1 Tax=Microlunatus sp. GCM10028923 TaxID=3273400 RepID=UPI00361E1FA1
MRAALAVAVSAIVAFGALVGPGDSAQAAAKAFFVDCSAAANGTGTEKSPWNSLAAVRPPGGAFAAGDSIRLKAGTSCSGSFIAKGSGSSTEPINLTSYGTGAKPIINGGGTVEAPVIIRDSSYWTVDGLEVTNIAAAEGKRSGVLVENTGNAVHRGITIKNLDVHHITGRSDRDASDRYVSAGIQVRLPAKASGLTGYFDGVTIENNEVRDVKSMGIAVVGSPNGDDTIKHNRNVVIRGNSVFRAAADSILIGVSVDPLVEHNVSYDAGHNAVNRGAIAGIWAYTSANPVFQFNESARTQPGPDSMGWDCDWGITGSCIYQYNYSHENSGGFYLECLTCFGPGQTDIPKLIVRYNVSQGEGIITSKGGNVKLEMYNNTLYNPDRPFDISLPSSALVANNIFVGSGLGRFDTDRGIVVDRNVYHGFNGPTADVNAIDADPKFANPGTGRDGLDTVDGYKLTAGSPALSKGRLIADNGGRDYWGNAVSATTAPHIGAYAGPVVANTDRPGTIVANGGFEDGLTSWSRRGSAAIVTADVQGGTKALSLSGGAVEQVVTGLQPKTTYTLSGWGKSVDAARGPHIGVKEYGGADIAVQFASTSYTKSTLTFTTGASATSARVYCYQPTSAVSHCDDIAVDPLLKNGGFEQGVLGDWKQILGTHDDNFVVAQDMQQGDYALQTSINGHSGVEQVVSGLVPGASYELTGWARSVKSGEEMRVGVYSFGNSEKFAPVTADQWTKVTVPFTMGDTATSAKIYCLKESGLDVGFCDTLSLTRVDSP